MSEYTTTQAIEFVQNKDVSSFRKAIDDILMDKISDAVELKKIQVASSFLEPKEDVQGETDGN